MKSNSARSSAGELTLIATLQNSPVGFASLKGANHIDMLYVHPSAVGQGVGAMLCDALEKLAGARGAKSSDGRCQRHRAAFLHEARLRRHAAQHRPRHGEWLANTTMQKTLAEAAPGAPQ